MQSIVSGRIARLVLIQLQFVKKELLVAMQAIDELFNANQVNLQLLSVTPAILAVVSLQIISRTLIAAIRATSRGRIVESSAAVHKELRDYMRQIERLVVLAENFDSEKATNHLQIDAPSAELNIVELGKLLSTLFRIQNILVVNASHFDAGLIKQLQEDLRELLLPQITARQQLAIIQRIYRAYPFMQPARRVFAGGLLQ